MTGDNELSKPSRIIFDFRTTEKYYCEQYTLCFEVHGFTS